MRQFAINHRYVGKKNKEMLQSKFDERKVTWVSFVRTQPYCRSVEQGFKSQRQHSKLLILDCLLLAAKNMKRFWVK